MDPEEEATKASEIAVEPGCNVVPEEPDEVLRKLDEKLEARIRASKSSREVKLPLSIVARQSRSWQFIV